jgi:hypothetical protein
MAVYVEVWSTVEGALCSSEPVVAECAEDMAYAAAEGLADIAPLQGFEEWAVYILPHCCDDSAECECVQYLTDHHPVYASATWSA